MTEPHAWTTEEIDGGAVGVGSFWRCSVCGAAGGPKDWWPEEPERRWRPFLAGPALKLDDDCLASQAIIWLHLTERLEGLASSKRKGLSPRYAATMKDALYRSPAQTDLTPFVGLLYDVERRQGRPSLETVTARLLQAGFLNELSAHDDPARFVVIDGRRRGRRPRWPSPGIEARRTTRPAPRP